jgi:hypothetical protein
MEKKYDIFISYRREGGIATANLLFEHLTRAGYRVFMDYEELRSGKFNDQLYDRINESKEVILVLAEDSLERVVNENDWLRLEIAHAIKLNKIIIPVLLRNFKWPANLPADIQELPTFQGIEASHELFDAFLKRLKKLLKSRRILSWKRIKSYILFALIPIVITIGVLLFIQYDRQKEEKKAYQQYEQICNSVVSNMGGGFVNGNILITTTKDIREEWNTFHQDIQKATNIGDKKRISEEFIKYLDYKHGQVKDTSKMVPFVLSDFNEQVLSGNGIRTEDIKAYPTMVTTDIGNTLDYIEKVKHWALTPEKGMPEQIDKAIGILADLNIEMISGGIYAYMQVINSMPKKAQEGYLKILHLLSEYPTDPNFNSTFAELEARQDLCFQKCNNLLQEYSEIVGEERKEVQSAQAALDLLKAKVQNQAHKDALEYIAARKDSLEAKKKLLTLKETELDQKKILVRQGYKRILAKDSLLKSDDQWLMWGKILHLANFGYDAFKHEKEAGNSNVVPSKEIFAQVQKRLDAYLEFNKTSDPEVVKYIPAAKQYFSLVSQGKLEYTGIIMVGTQDNVAHPVLKTGDIVIERKGKTITSMDDYIKLKEDPASNVLKIIRFTSAKKTMLTETIPADCKVMVGFLNLRPKE